MSRPTGAATVARVFIGTYTNGQSRGIYRSELNLSTGELAPVVLVAEVSQPSFLALDPKHQHLYAVSEVEDHDGKKSGAVVAYKIAADGGLTRLNEQPSRGANPCHIIVDATGSIVLVANYSSGSVTMLPIREDGSLAEPRVTIQHQGSSVNPQRQEGPHAHSVNLDAGNRFAVVADLGLDQLLVYRYSDRMETIIAHERQRHVDLARGAGPRHFAFHPDGKHAYVINELNSTITALAYDAQDGTFRTLETVSTLPSGDYPGNSTADIHVHQSGKWVYGSNRGHDSIAIFAVDAETGNLRPLGHEKVGGRTPRNFAIDPTGTYLLAESENSDLIRVFRINQDTGLLAQTGHDLAVPTPVCVQMYLLDGAATK